MGHVGDPQRRARLERGEGQLGARGQPEVDAVADLAAVQQQNDARRGVDRGDGRAHRDELGSGIGAVSDQTVEPIVAHHRDLAGIVQGGVQGSLGIDPGRADGATQIDGVTDRIEGGGVDLLDDAVGPIHHEGVGATRVDLHIGAVDLGGVAHLHAGAVDGEESSVALIDEPPGLVLDHVVVAAGSRRGPVDAGRHPVGVDERTVGRTQPGSAIERRLRRGGLADPGRSQQAEQERHRHDQRHHPTRGAGGTDPAAQPGPARPLRERGPDEPAPHRWLRLRRCIRGVVGHSRVPLDVVGESSSSCPCPNRP